MDGYDKWVGMNAGGGDGCGWVGMGVSGLAWVCVGMGEGGQWMAGHDMTWSRETGSVSKG